MARSIELLRGWAEAVAAVNRETRIGVALVALLGLLVFGMLVVGSLGGPRPDLQRLTVGEILAQDAPAHLRDRRAADRGLVRGPRRRLRRPPGRRRRPCLAAARLPAPRAPVGAAGEGVTQAELQRDGLRLAAPNGAPFPPRSQPAGANLRLEQLIFTGHFDDAASSGASPTGACRNTFVVSTYDGLVH